MIKSLFFSFILILTLALSNRSSAENEAVTIDSITNSKIIHNVPFPTVLYHWTKLSNLELIAGSKKFSDKWDTFKKRERNQVRTSFFRWWPQFEVAHGGLFTWTHPILGMKGGEFEQYGNNLIRIEIDPQITRAARVVPGNLYSDGQPKFQSPLDVSNIDLVDNGREWVIVNPRIIKNFTADIDELRPLLEKELALLKDPNHRYDKNDIHFEDFKGGGYRDSAYLQYAIQVIENLLRTRSDAIPPYFRRDSEGNYIGDKKWISGEETLKTARTCLDLFNK